MPLDLARTITHVQDRVAAACAAASREPDEVRLLLAAKTQPAALVRRAVEVAEGLGLATAGPSPRLLVGENRVQELTAKATELADLGLEMHLIGPLQSNKVNHALRALALHGRACVESVDSWALAERLSGRVVAGALPAPLDVLVQVNVSGESTKSGVAPEGANDLAAAVGGLDGLRLRGFMTIGTNTTDRRLVRAGFETLRDIRDTVCASGAAGTSEATDLSMGMSRDLEEAVLAGATIVRVGTAVFGARPPQG
ncbi:YggS family pyridoxal phosphate-dependent enzyme [Sanguibacter sp. 25GB23B1]|uniref:YggS family pyridoxal phosphate-dependent enzyme n=1 Tax=unclassified Sanguibacter TaxID=2645534 RepID=UPI0032AEDAB7